MFSMTHNLIQCQFGCGLKIYYEIIEFSDGWKIRIPRQDDDSIHDCSRLPSGEIDDMNFEFDEYLYPDDPDADEEFHTEYDVPWLKEDLEDHFSKRLTEYGSWSGLEFKNTRDRFKKSLIQQLLEVPHFYDQIPLEDPEEYRDESDDPFLPPCLDLRADYTFDAPPYNCFHPLEILGLFYQMDGRLGDAATCFKLQEELGVSIIDVKNKLKEIQQEEPKKSQVIQQPPRPESEIEAEQRKVEMEIKKFEHKDFNKYIIANITKEELRKKLQSTVINYRQLTKKEKTKIVEEFKKDGMNSHLIQNVLKKKWFTEKDLNDFDIEKKWSVPNTLLDKARKQQSKEEKRQLVRKNPIDLHFLSLSDKIQIVENYTRNGDKLIKNKEIIECLWSINWYRTNLAHNEPDQYYSDGLEITGQETRICIKKCKLYMETEGV